MSDFSTIWVTYGWGAVSVVAVLLSILFAALGYTFGVAFRLREVAIWSREELLQAMASGLILAYAATFVVLLSELSCSLVGKAGCSVGNDQMTVARNIVGNLTQNVTNQTNYIFQLNMRAAFTSSLVKYWDFSWGPFTNVFTGQLAFGFSISPWAGTSIIVESINYIFGLLIPILSSLVAQGFLLELIDKSLFPTFLAMGIILRTFFFSRKTGGLLMAIAIGIYTIYPLMYVLMQPFFTLPVHDFEVETPDIMAGNCGVGCASSSGAFCTGVITPSKVPFCMSSGGVIAFYTLGVFTVGNTLTPSYMFYTGSKTVNKTVYGGMQTPYDGVLPTVGYLLVPAAFLPLLNILITISFIKILSPTLGGDVEIAGITRII